MAISTPLQSQPRAALRRAVDPRIPHPSWRETITGSDQGAGVIRSARDFWARLDL